MSSSPPATIGKYQIIREIARSNDIVYEAYDPLMNRRVALKELAMPGGATDQVREERIKRFQREAKAAASKEHPNIVTIFEIGEDAGRHYIAMEYLDGHTLRNELDTHGFVPFDKAIEIAVAVLGALDAAHKSGVIHRDIKPENIQLLSDGRIKLTDFGIARVTFEPNLTSDGQVFGTPSYMSPEQVAGRDIDARSDLFSLGVVLYEMISGTKPFAGDSVVSITYAIVNKEPTQPSQCSYPVWQVIQRVLDKSPQLRYGSASDMKAALDAAVQQNQSGVYGANDPGFAVPGSQPTMSGTIGPYGAAPANANPYAMPSPYMAQPAPPPVYPYNPYPQPGQSPNPTIPPGAYPSGQGFPPTPYGTHNPPPIYYPPPPPKPLFSPETKIFFKRLFTTLLVLGALFALVIVTISSLGTAVRRYQDQNADGNILADLEKKTATMSLSDKAATYEQSLIGLRSDVTKGEIHRILAVTYERLGKQQLANSDTTNAEASFRRAMEMDPANARLASNLGLLYETIARKAEDRSQRKQAWEESAKYWIQAANAERDPEQQSKFAEGAAKAYFSLAQEASQDGDQKAFMNYFNLAMQYAPPDSNVFDWLNRLQR